MTDLGFIGLGHMGAPMAERLLAPAVRLHVHDQSPAKMAVLVDKGAVAHQTPASVADAASIVFACLPSQSVSRSVAASVAGGGAIRIYAEMSTIGRQTMCEIAETLGLRGIAVVDAPISGGPPGARAGTLAMMASGVPEAVEQVRPFLARIGRTVFVIGDKPGMAQVMKLVNNVISATNMVTAFEALVMGAKAGLDADMMVDVVNASTGRSLVTEYIVPKAVLTGTFDFGASTAIMSKDAELGVAEAHALGVPAWTIEQAARLWRMGVLQGAGQDDFTTLIKLLEGWSGTEVRSRR
jgi:3-hydroxyisobutyrate dehydrogenase